VLVVMLKFLQRGVLRKVVQFLETGYALKLAPASVGALIKRVSLAVAGEYDAMKERIRTAARVYVDETSFSVLGKNWWVWVFRTAEDVLLVIRPSRGSDVLLEILGEHFPGIVICDCWRAYDFFGRLQRCWSHLIRKAKEFQDSVPGRHLLKRLRGLFSLIKRFNRIPHTQKQRKAKYTHLTKALKDIVRYYSRYDELHKVIEYISNNLANWFTCVLYENVEPTNNYAEQAIRETVMVRKIIGAFRSESGPEDYSVLASLIATWNLQKRDLAQELRRTLVKNICFC
jgi:hypothetical protein